MHIYYWNSGSLYDELDRAFSEIRSSSEGPAFDIEDDEDATTLTADLPGMTADDIEVTVSAPMLIVRGERRVKDGHFVRRNRWHGSFERRFRLGDGHDLDDIKAHVADGVLTVRLAKTAKMKPRRIKLTGGVVEKVKGLLSGEKKVA